MRAFLAAVIVMIAIAVGADVVLNDLGYSSAARTAGADVRLD